MQAGLRLDHETAYCSRRRPDVRIKLGSFVKVRVPVFLRTARVIAALGALAAFLMAWPAAEIEAARVDDAFFAEKLYPILDQAQCRLCHGEKGVASTTRLEFPREDASAARITAFGLALAEFIDPQNPSNSLLFRKPTNRQQHTGGERIKQGSGEEKLLLSWIGRLAELSADERSAAIASGLSHAGGPHHGVMRRLTHSQYNNTVRDLLGDRTQPANQFPPEDFIRGFKNQAEGQSVPPLLAEAYGAAAEKLARNAFRGGDRNRLVPCAPRSAADSRCRMKFLRTFGRRAFRRPLTDGEVAQYDALFRKEAAAGDFLRGAQIAVEAMLQSPRFLFRMEHGPEGPWYSYEVAARLSYFLWDTMPDEKLFRLAEQGKLETPEQVGAAAREMLQDPRSRKSMEEFLGQWLRFDRVLDTIRDRRLYRDFNPELAAAMTEETKRLFGDLVWNDGNFMDFFRADYGFISTDLANLYQLSEPESEFARVDFPEDSGRGGIFGQAMFLTVTSKPSDTSPTERGLYVREHFLCQEVPPPPPGLNTSLPPVTDEKPMTNRERLNIHLTSESCASCHRLIDPIGFGFENYDAIGRHRDKHYLTIYPTRDEVMKGLKKKETKYELPIDSSASVTGIVDSEFSTPKELGEILAKEPSCRKCIVRQLFRYAMGREETPDDRATIERLYADFRDSRFRFRELIISLVQSDVFRGAPVHANP